MRQVAAKYKVLFVDAFTPSMKWYQKSQKKLTIDGSQLNNQGYSKLALLLADKIFGKTTNKVEKHREAVSAAVEEKNWFWHNDFKIPNGVHVYGQRYNPFGPQNYPAELKKLREMTAIRDQAIWAAAQGQRFDLKAADAKTSTLPKVKTNYRGASTYNKADDKSNTLTVAEGYKMEVFASETEFPNLANPMQMSFDNKGAVGSPPCLHTRTGSG